MPYFKNYMQKINKNYMHALLLIIYIYFRKSGHFQKVYKDKDKHNEYLKNKFNFIDSIN